MYALEHLVIVEQYEGVHRGILNEELWRVCNKRVNSE
jgi:hypothetical protein